MTSSSSREPGGTEPGVQSSPCGTTIWAWDNCNNGQLGLGTFSGSAHPTPTEVGGGSS